MDNYQKLIKELKYEINIKELEEENEKLSNVDDKTKNLKDKLAFVKQKYGDVIQNKYEKLIILINFFIICLINKNMLE